LASIRRQARTPSAASSRDSAASRPQTGVASSFMPAWRKNGDQRAMAAIASV
jgi:hypothetical protein